MSDEFDDFFGEEAPKVKNAEVKEIVENPILFDEPEANVNLLLAEKLSDHQIAYLVKLAHQCNARVRVVYCFPFVANEKHMVKGMGKFFAENVRSDLKNYFIKDHPIVTVGRALYATTFDTDVQVDSFYDSVFNHTYFYSPFVNNRVYPIDNAFRICGFGQPDPKSGEPIYFWDRFETFFAREQFKRAAKAGNCSLVRKRNIVIKEIENCNEWLLAHSQNVPDNELWVAVDSETGGFKKLENRIGNISLSFNGYEAFYLDWKNINPRIFSKFLNAHKCIYANGKFDILFFAYHGCDLHNLDWDTMVAGHFLNEMRSNSLKTHAFWYTNYGGYDLELERYKWKYPGMIDYTKIPKSIRMPYAGMDAAITYQVWLREKEDMMKEPDLYKYYIETAVPMINVFVKAEYKGFCINWAAISKTGDELQEKIRVCKKAVRDAYNEPDLDVNSKQAVGDMLQSHGYPAISIGKTGHYKVSKVELHEWQKMDYKEVETLLELSKWTALWQTFIGEDASDDEDQTKELDEQEESDSFFNESSTVADKFSNDCTGLWKYKAPDGCVHTTFHPFMAQSHRHRSSDPNLQNIPKKNYEATKLVRTAYTTPDTIPCKPEEADKIVLLCKDSGYISLYSGETISIGGKVCLGKDIYKLDLDSLGIRAEYEKFYKKDFPQGTESYLQIEDSERGSLILPIYEDSAKKKFVEIFVKRNGTVQKVFTKDLQEGDELVETEALKAAC